MRTASLTILLVALGLLVASWATTSGTGDQGTAAAPGGLAQVTTDGGLAETREALVEPAESAEKLRAESVAAPATEVDAAPAPAGSRTSLSGRVLDERGAPLANADVRAERASGDMLVVLADGDLERALGKTRTGRDGRFRLELEATSAVRVSVGVDGYAPLEERVSVHAGQDKDIGDLELDRGAILSGRVFDSAGAAVAGVDILRPRASGSGIRILGLVSGEVVGATDAEGRFRVARQAVGPWKLAFRPDDHPDAELEGITDRPGEVVENLEVVLDDGFTIAGRATGLPVDPGNDVNGGPRSMIVRAREPGVQRLVMQGDMSLGGSAERERTATLAADGSFRVTGLTRDTDYALTLRRDVPFTYRGRACSDTVVARAGERGVELAYDTGSVLAFQVIDGRTKAPVEDCEVQAGIQWTRPLTDDSGRAVRKHPGGLVRFPNLRPKDGDTAQVRIEAVGYAPFEEDGIVLATSGETELGVLELTPVPVLRVRVTDRSSGAPLAGARLSLSPARESGGGRMFAMRREVSQEGDHVSMPGQEAHRGETGADGWGTVTSFPGETCALTVNADDFAQLFMEEIELPKNVDHELRAELGRGALVRIEVVDVAGAPVSGARVEHRDAGGPAPGMLLGGRGVSERTDAHGIARYERLAPGTHSFRIDEENEGGGGVFFAMAGPGDDAPLGEGWESLAVLDGESYELKLVAPGRGTLSGIIREDGVPLAGAAVSLSENGAARRGLGRLFGGGPEARTDSQGRYEIDDLKAGTYTLSVEHALRAMPHEADVAIAAGPNAFDADLPVAVVEGRVLDENGTGKAGATVRITRRESGTTQANFVIAFSSGDEGGPVVASTDLGLGPARAETDEQGRYRMRGVASDTELYVEARAEGYEPITSEDFQVAPGELRTGVDVHLDKGGTIVVRVTGDAPDGIGPLVRATFVGESEEDEDVEPRLDVVNGGAARLEGLRRGDWEVSLEAMGESEAEVPEPKIVTVRPGEESLAEFER